jgi:hypothetical protein
LTGSEQKEPAEIPVPVTPGRRLDSVMSMLTRGRRLILVVGAVLVGGIAAAAAYGLLDRGRDTAPPRPGLAAAPPPAAVAQAGVATNGAQVVIGWAGRDGAQYRTTVDSLRYQEFAAQRQQQGEQERQQLVDAATSRARAALFPIFEEIEARVPEFGNWVFDWWTSWVLLGRSIGWVWEGLGDGPLLTMPDRVQERLVLEIEQQFDQLVLQPEATDPRLTAALDRIRAALSEDLAQQCRRYEMFLRTFIIREARRIEKRMTGGDWAAVSAREALSLPPAATCAAEGRTEEFHVVELMKLRQERTADDPVNAVILRMSRPFATKLISYVILPAILTGLIGGLVLPLLGILPNFLSGALAGLITGAAGAAIIGFSASTSVDWFLTREDERRNRAGFEVQVRRAVIVSRDAFEARIVEVQRRSIERQIRALIESPTVLGASP